MTSVAIVGAVTGTATGFSIVATDSGASVVDTNTVILKLNGNSVTPNSITKVGDTTTATYTLGSATPLASGSTNTVVFTAKDTNNVALTGTRCEQRFKFLQMFRFNSPRFLPSVWFEKIR